MLPPSSLSETFNGILTILEGRTESFSFTFRAFQRFIPTHLCHIFVLSMLLLSIKKMAEIWSTSYFTHFFCFVFILSCFLLPRILFAWFPAPPLQFILENQNILWHMGCWGRVWVWTWDLMFVSPVIYPLCRLLDLHSSSIPPFHLMNLDFSESGALITV